MSDKIAAIATGHARTGIGVLRLSGDGCIEAAEQVFRLNSGRPLSSLSDRKLALGTLFDAQGRPIDHCMAFISRAPHSYTGEDTAEIQCHGSPAALTAGLEALFAAGFRQARPGEFTRRAFLNGQMDLTQAEAVIDLIDAETADAAANAAGQVAGAIRKKIDPIYDSWVDLCAHFHAVLDYPDEDIDPFTLSGYEASLTESSRQLTALLTSCHRGRMVQSGIKAVILGSPNAGKSSLLNRLSGFDRVIVTDIPGTTRDVVRGSILVAGLRVNLSDTAGIREQAETVEAIGVQRAREIMRAADLVLLVLDGSQPLTAEDEELLRETESYPRLILCNKADRGAAFELPGALRISAATGEGMDALRQELARRAGMPCELPLTSERHMRLARAAAQHLQTAADALENGQPLDLAAIDLHAALDCLGEVTGDRVDEKLLDSVFSRFCVGK